MKPKARNLLRGKRRAMTVSISDEARGMLIQQAEARNLSRSRLLELLIRATPILPLPVKDGEHPDLLYGRRS